MQLTGRGRSITCT